MRMFPSSLRGFGENISFDFGANDEPEPEEIFAPEDETVAAASEE